MSRVMTAADVLTTRLDAADALRPDAVALALDTDSARVTDALAVLRQRQTVIVGLTTGASRIDPRHRDACDVLIAPLGSEEEHAVGSVDPEAEASRVLAAFARSPRAATVLADTLRLTTAVPIPEALHAESLAYSALLAGAEFATWLATRTHRRTHAPERPAVRVSRDGSTLHLTLDDPERRNAFSAAMRDALVEALAIPEVDEDVTEILLDGAGPSFCAGGDLTEFGTNTDGALTHLIRTRAGAGAPMARLADRLTAHVHGHCIGAGIELPAFARTVVAHRDTLFRLPEVAMGLIPGAGGTVSIPRRIGRHRTYWMGITGSPVDAATALAWGLVDRVHSTHPDTER